MKCVSLVKYTPRMQNKKNCWEVKFLFKKTLTNTTTHSILWSYKIIITALIHSAPPSFRHRGMHEVYTKTKSVPATKNELERNKKIRKSTDIQSSHLNETSEKNLFFLFHSLYGNFQRRCSTLRAYKQQQQQPLHIKKSNINENENRQWYCVLYVWRCCVYGRAIFCAHILL